MEGSQFDEAAFFVAVFWLHVDDIEVFNRATAPFDLVPNHPRWAARPRDAEDVRMLELLKDAEER